MKKLWPWFFVAVMAWGCAPPIPTSEFEALKTKICGCPEKDAACAEQLVADLQAFKHRGGSPEDPDAATALITEAAKCARKRVPDINGKIVEALKK